MTGTRKFSEEKRNRSARKQPTRIPLFAWVYVGYQRWTTRLCRRSRSSGCSRWTSNGKMASDSSLDLPVRHANSLRLVPEPPRRNQSERQNIVVSNEQTFLTYSAEKLKQYADRIFLCLDQLTPE